MQEHIQVLTKQSIKQSTRLRATNRGDKERHEGDSHGVSTGEAPGTSSGSQAWRKRRCRLWRRASGGRRGDEEEESGEVGKKRSERRRRSTKLTSCSFTIFSSLPSPLTVAVSSPAAIRRSKSVSAAAGRWTISYVPAMFIFQSDHHHTITNKYCWFVNFV